MFQNQPISKNRTNHQVTTTSGLSNRDLLPRICLSIDENKLIDKQFIIEIIFNDYNRIAQSTLMTQKTFKLRMFYLILDNVQRNLLVLTIENLKLNDSIRLQNVLPGAYLIEVIEFKTF